MYIIFGLGNIGEEYKNTRHNAGAIIVNEIKDNFPKKVKFVEVSDYMNDSGKTISYFVKNKKDLEKLIVIYDDIDLPFGKIKISFNRSAGGHNGVGSIIKTLKTEEFLRIRIGVAPTTPTGKIKKPKGEDKVVKFLLGDFKKEELEKIKKLSKEISKILEIIISEGYPKAMTLYN